MSLIQLLLDSHADVTLVDDEGYSAMVIAVASYRRDPVKLLDQLTKAGADTNAATASGLTAVHNAATFGRDAALSWLIRKGAAVNVATRDGVTPLMKAAQRGEMRCIELLLGAGAHMNAVNTKKQSAVDYAESAAQTTSVSYLKKEGGLRGLDANGNIHAVKTAASADGTTPAATPKAGAAGASPSKARRKSIAGASKRGFTPADKPTGKGDEVRAGQTVNAA